MKLFAFLLTSTETNNSKKRLHKATYTLIYTLISNIIVTYKTNHL